VIKKNPHKNYIICEDTFSNIELFQKVGLAFTKKKKKHIKSNYLDENVHVFLVLVNRVLYVLLSLRVLFQDKNKDPRSAKKKNFSLILIASSIYQYLLNLNRELN
jgi:hypothetical protein